MACLVKAASTSPELRCVISNASLLPFVQPGCMRAGNTGEGVLGLPPPILLLLTADYSLASPVQRVIKVDEVVNSTFLPNQSVSISLYNATN